MVKKISIPDSLRQAGAGVVVGLILSGVDSYFGGGNALFGYLLILTGTAGGLMLHFWVAARKLRCPRIPDLFFVAGADYSWRKKKVLSEIHSMLVQAPWVVVPAGSVLSLIQSPGMPVAAGALVVFLLTLLALTMVFRLTVNREWLPISNLPFFQSFSIKRPTGLRGSVGMHLKTTRSLALLLSRPFPRHYRSLLAHKLLYPLRTDLGSFLVWFLVLLTVGAACWWSGNPRLIGAFALLSATAAVTAYQLGTLEADRFGRECPHYTWGEKAYLKADVSAAATLGLVFAIFAGMAQITGGDGTSAGFFWKFTLAPLLPALIAPLDNPERDWSGERRLYMNGGYLFVTAYLLLTPTWVMAMVVAALVSFSFQKAFAPLRPV